MSRTWYLHVFVRGHYSGAYVFPTKKAAIADRDDRRKRLSVVGCHYHVSKDEYICHTCDRPVGRGDVLCESCKEFVGSL